MSKVILKRPSGSNCCGEAPSTGAAGNTVCDCNSTSDKANDSDCNDGCGKGIQMKQSETAGWVTGKISTSVGEVQQVSVRLSLSDIWGSVKARFGAGRDNYKVEPGIYAIGNPDQSSPVLVTANYKMTFDSLRRELSGLNTWVLVLDTKGINVWCAAGKGTFGTAELVKRISRTSLASVVSHRTLILPQLGAPGVSAHEVRRQSGFQVVYGPIRASDLKAFLENGMIADEAMRAVRFPMIDRFVLTPLEFVNTFKPFVLLMGAFFLLNLIGLGHFGIVDVYAIAGAIFAGTVLTPVLLPFLPGRAFSLKGGLLGLLWTAAVLWMNGFPGTPAFGWLMAVSYLLILPTVSSYLAMNFTGCSTYTSFSGVKREMQVAIPLMLVTMGLGILFLVADMIVKLF